MKFLTSIFVVLILTLLTTSCDSTKSLTSTGNTGDSCNSQTFDVAGIASVSQAMDVAKAAEVLKLSDLKVKALAKADEIFNKAISDANVLEDDPSVVDFPMNQSAAAYMMMKCGKAMNLYGAKADNDEDAKLKLEAEKTDIDLKLLKINTNKVGLRSEKFAEELNYGSGEKILSGLRENVNLAAATLPFFCVPCGIILGIDASLSGVRVIQEEQVRILDKLADPIKVVSLDAAFSCDSEDMVTLCDNMMSGGGIGEDPCGVSYTSKILAQEQEAGIKQEELGLLK